MSKIMVRTLDCGVRVIMEKIDYVKSAAFGVWVKAGAVYETSANAGVSHFIEHMMFKGTEKRSARQTHRGECRQAFRLRQVCF